MDKKRVFGIILILISIIVLLFNLTITGAVVGDFIQTSSNIFSIILLVGGLALFLSKKNLEGKVQSNVPVQIKIHKKVIQRAKKDKTVRNNLTRYLNEIKKIAQNPLDRPKEQMEDFFVSPQGNIFLRIPWYYDSKKNTLYIYDLLYHTKEGNYTGNWNLKVRQGKIKRQHYHKSDKDFQERI